MDRCRAVGSRAGTRKVLIRMLAALVGVSVWLVGGVEQQRRLCPVSEGFSPAQVGDGADLG